MCPGIIPSATNTATTVATRTTRTIQANRSMKDMCLISLRGYGGSGGRHGETMPPQHASPCSGLWHTGDLAGRLFAQPTVQDPAERAADQRRDPEQPKLHQSPSTDEQGGPGAARRVHRRVGHRDADEVDE